jgi:Ca2+-binding RTX toxin-like protein
MVSVRALCEAIEPRVLLSASGEQDHAFGSDGISSVAGITSGAWNAIVVHNGQIIVAGVKNGVADSDLIAARFNSSGKIDASFGMNGLIDKDFGGGDDSAQTLFVRDDGTIVIGGTIDGAPATVQFLADGSALDTHFGGGDGILNGFVAMGLESNGDLIGVNGGSIQRIDSSGNLVTTFGNGGSVDLVQDTAIQSIASAVNVRVQSDGSVLAATTGSIDGDLQNNLPDAIVLKLDSSGKPVNSFSSDGVYVRRFDGDTATRVLAAPGTGATTFVATESLHGNDLIKLDDTGKQDTSFNYKGQVTDIAVRSDGKIDIVGASHEILQLLADGSADERFNAGRPAYLDFRYQTNTIVATSDAILAAGAFDVGTPFITRVFANDSSAPIVFFKENHRIAIYGTGGPDTITVKRNSSDFIVSIHQTSLSFLRSSTKSIVVWAEGGNDNVSIDGQRTDITVFAGSGNDTVKILSGDTANLDGAGGNDYLSAAGIDAKFTGPCRLIGGSGNDHLIGSEFADDLQGQSGNDTLEGGGSSDGLAGGSGNDLLLGQDGGDTIRGDAGNDTLNGGPGYDHYYASSGDDTYLMRDGLHESVFDASGNNKAQIDTGAHKDDVAGNFTLIA